LSALTEHPYWVIRLFHKNEVNNYGVYGVWLNVNGEWRNIVVDDNFPCMSEKQGPAFSRANGFELWVLLIEKAYAKIYGSYEIIEGGNPAIALRDLTGAPYENKDDVSADEQWNFMKDNFDKG
jgi:calpain-15